MSKIFRGKPPGPSLPPSSFEGSVGAVTLRHSVGPISQDLNFSTSEEAARMTWSDLNGRSYPSQTLLHPDWTNSIPDMSFFFVAHSWSRKYCAWAENILHGNVSRTRFAAATSQHNAHVWLLAWKAVQYEACRIDNAAAAGGTTLHAFHRALRVPVAYKF